MNKSKIVILGVLPPPIGGVTIHLKRLLTRLQNEEVSFKLFDYKRQSIISGIRKMVHAEIIHINCSNKSLRLFIILVSLLFRKKTIITWHGKYLFKSLLDNLSLRLCSVNLVLNEQSYSCGFKHLHDEEKIKLISAFIPPSEEENLLSEEIQSNLRSFISKFDCIIATNAPNYVIDNEGYDLYGIDFVLEMVSKLKNVGLIVSDSSGALGRKYSLYKGLTQYLFISEPHSFMGVMQYSDIMVRATTTDGDSLSVKEAVFLGKKVIATDCVERPEGCFVFKVRNEQSFIDTFNNLCKNESDKSILINGYDQIVSIYQDILIKYNGYGNMKRVKE